MGEVDLEKLFKIYDQILIQSKNRNWKFKFTVDKGSYETRVDIHDDNENSCFIGNGKLPLIGYSMWCPDLLDFRSKLAIEFEEEAGGNTGYFHAKKSHKGHSEYTNTRDTERDAAYKRAKIILLKIWESDMKSNLWIRKLVSFLTLQAMFPSVQ